MSKLIKINDRKPIEIYIGRKTRGPVSGIRLSDAVIGRILRSMDAPKDVYAMGPNNTSVKLTLDNYMLSEDELFNGVKSVPVIDDNETKAKAEALRKSLEAKKNAEIKQDEVKSEAVETVSEKATVEDDSESEVQVDEKVEEDTVTEEKEEEAPVVTEEPKQEAAPKNYNNYNKNYNNNKNKNKK